LYIYWQELDNEEIWLYIMDGMFFIAMFHMKQLYVPHETNKEGRIKKRIEGNI